MNRRVIRSRPVLFAVGAVLIVATACGGAKASTSGGAAAPSGSGGAAAGSGQREFPGASGLIAAVSGQTLQVQSSTAQTAVTYTSTTRFTQTVAATAADLKVGMCVQARPARSTTGSSAAPPSSGSASVPSGPVTAATVELSSPVNGTCTGGFGGFGGGDRTGARPSGVPTDRPSGAPSMAPGGAPGGGANGAGGFGGFGATGKITSVSGGSFVVTEQRRVGTGSTSTPTASPSTTSTTITVLTTSATTYTKTVTATAAAAQVGRCATAIGKTNDTGAVAATSIAIRAATNGTCTGRGPNG